MKKMTTSTGFTFKTDADALDNIELLDAIGELEKNPLAITRVVTLLLGEEQKNALYDHVRNEKGRVPAEALSKEIAEIFRLLEAGLKK